MTPPEVSRTLADGFEVWRSVPADRTHAVDVDGHRVTVHDHGDEASPDVLFLLDGGPGPPCDYLCDPHLPLADHGCRVVVHDQLGTGDSDRPDDPSLRTLERYVEEVETVLDAAGFERVHFLGHSWGGRCGIEYALGSETVATMQRFEAEERYDHPAYEAAATLLDHRHMRRLPARPAPVQRSRDGFNEPIFMAVQGPNGYHRTGTILRFARLDDIGRFDWPTPIVHGAHDAITPECGRLVHDAIPGSTIRICPNSSHSPFYEEPEPWRATLLDFLDGRRGEGARP